MRRLSLVIVLVLVTLFLTACDLQILTDIKEDGSGEFGFEMGIPDDEIAALAAFEMTPQQLCDEAQGESDLEGATVELREEEGVTYCLIKAPFTDLNELREAYADSDTTVTSLQFNDAGDFIYDVTVDMGADDTGDLTEGLDVEINMSWSVTLPGSIGENNADEVNGNTLTWNLAPGQVVNMQAQSSPGGGFPTWIVILVLLSCLCLLVLVAAGGAFYFMRMRK